MNKKNLNILNKLTGRTYYVCVCVSCRVYYAKLFIKNFNIENMEIVITLRHRNRFCYRHLLWLPLGFLIASGPHKLTSSEMNFVLILWAHIFPSILYSTIIFRSLLVVYYISLIELWLEKMRQRRHHHTNEQNVCICPMILD